MANQQPDRIVDEDMFGNKIEKNILLRDKFMEPPFSVLDTKGGAMAGEKKGMEGDWYTI